MSTFLFLCLHIFILQTLAGQQSSPYNAITASDPNSFDVIPRCAYDCFITFISYSFPASVCPGTEDVVCLCTSDSRSGFTLGEGALRCLASGCEPDTTSDFQKAYEICKGIPDAQPETHGTISASMLQPTTIIVPTSVGVTTKIEPVQSSQASLTSHSHSHQTTSSVVLATSTLSPIASPSNSFLSSVVGATSSPFNSALAASAASASPSAAPVLNHAQVVGVAVSGGVVGSAAFGLLFFIFCIRNKRDRRRRDSDASFGVIGELGGLAKQSRSLPGDRESSRAAADPNVPKTVRLLGAPGGPGQKRWTLWKSAMEKQPSPQAQIQDVGFAVSPPSQRAVTHESSPVSAKSYHTSSGLLPDKPNLKHSKSPRQAASFALSKVPERKPVSFAAGAGLRVNSQTVPPAQQVQPAWHEDKAIQRPPTNFVLRHQKSDPFIDSQSDPRARLYAMERRTASTRDLPPIVPPGDQGSLGSPWKYVPDPLFSKQQVSQSKGDMVSQEQTSYIPPESTRFPNQTASSHYSNHSSYPTSANQDNPQASFNKWASLKTRRSSNNRPLTNYTAGSDTSFEDDGDIPNELPSQSSTLSPVRESPQHRGAVTPISKVRYPAIPGRDASLKHLKVTPHNQRSPTYQGRGTEGGLQSIGVASPPANRPRLVDVGRSPNIPLYGNQINGNNNNKERTNNYVDKGHFRRISRDPYGETPVELPVQYYEDSDYFPRQQSHHQGQLRSQRQQVYPKPMDYNGGGWGGRDPPQWEITRSPGVGGMETWGGSPKSPRSRNDRHFPSSKGYNYGARQQYPVGVAARPQLPPPQPQWENTWR